MSKILLHSNPPDSELADIVLIRTAPHRRLKNCEVRLQRVPVGYEPAGGIARYTDGYYAVLFPFDGAEHGRRFKNLDDATDYFDQLTGRESFNPVKHADGTVDRRYRVQLEHAGRELPDYVLRFCDDFLGAYQEQIDAVEAALKHARRYRPWNMNNPSNPKR